jgi:RND family efflux transporter MFP subunit
VALAQKKLADAVLRSPLDGAVARRLVNEGEYVRTGTPAFHLVRTAPLCFRGEVPERYAIALREGAEVNARTAAAPGLVLRGTVTRISPAVTVESRGLPFEAQVENPGDILKPGAFATLSVLLGRRPALVVPEGAVLLSAGVARAWVVVDGRVHERLLTLDGRSGNLLRVRSGLVAGETVAASAVERLTEGQAVQARPTGGRP